MTSATAPEGDRDRLRALALGGSKCTEPTKDWVDTGGPGRWFARASRWPCSAYVMFLGPLV